MAKRLLRCKGICVSRAGLQAHTLSFQRERPCKFRVLRMLALAVKGVPALGPSGRPRPLSASAQDPPASRPLCARPETPLFILPTGNGRLSLWTSPKNSINKIKPSPVQNPRTLRLCLQSVSVSREGCRAEGSSGAHPSSLAVLEPGSGRLAAPPAARLASGLELGQGRLSTAPRPQLPESTPSFPFSRTWEQMLATQKRGSRFYVKVCTQGFSGVNRWRRWKPRPLPRGAQRCPRTRSLPHDGGGGPRPGPGVGGSRRKPRVPGQGRNHSPALPFPPKIKELLGIKFKDWFST